MVSILTDSTSDLSPELIEKYHIRVIPLTIILQDQVKKDGIDITSQELFHSVEQTGKLPQTSAPSIAEFVELYNQVPREGIFIGISSRMSATWQNATLAAGQVGDKDIRVIDSSNLSGGIAILVLRAAEMSAQGHSLDEIEAATQALIPKMHTSFIIETLDYLYKGGRCSALQSIASSILKIRPIIEVQSGGTLGVKDKTRGTRKNALNYLVQDFKKNVAAIDPHLVFIVHTGCDEDAAYLQAQLGQITPIDSLYVTNAGSTISTHCGPGTIGIIYQAK
ncbi:MAG: DegV family protein [Chloroflexi bacterium]|nr:DegV family protein [Chloroflexota bacterium]